MSVWPKKTTTVRSGWPLAKLSFCSEEIRGKEAPKHISSNDDRMRESESFGGEEEGDPGEKQQSPESAAMPGIGQMRVKKRDFYRQFNYV